MRDCDLEEAAPRLITNFGGYSEPSLGGELTSPGRIGWYGLTAPLC